MQNDDNRHKWDKMYSSCYFYGRATDMPFPESTQVNNNFICQDCFKKYSPTLFEISCENNKKYWEEDERKFYEFNHEYLEEVSPNNPILTDEEDGDLPF